MTLENCPNCQKKLSPPFRSSNRQVCTTCGWTNKSSSKNVSANRHDSFANNTSDRNKDNIVDEYADTYKNLLEGINLSSNKIEEEAKKIILFLNFLQWILVFILVIYGLYLLAGYQEYLGWLDLILVTPSSYFSIQITIVIIKLITRIEINTRSN